MKKFFKIFLALSLALVCIVPIGLTLAGCSKNYTVNVEIKAGNGDVFIKNVDGQSVVGRNTVKSGEKFEFFVSPQNGYIIDKVVIGGVEQDPAGYDATGAYLYIEKVQKNTTVEVTFKRREWTVTFKCKGAAEGEWETYTTKNVLHEGTLDLTSDPLKKDGVNWYAVLSSGKKYYLNNGREDPTLDPQVAGYIPYVIFVTRDIEVRTDLTRAELVAILEA